MMTCPKLGSSLITEEQSNDCGLLMLAEINRAVMSEFICGLTENHG